MQCLLDAIYEINQAWDHKDFVTAVLAGMMRLVSCDYANFHVLEIKTSRLLHRITPENPYNEPEVAFYQAHPQAHPLVAYYQRTQDPRAKRISDVLTTREYLASAHYRNCNARLGLRYILGLPIQVDAGAVGGITYCRRHRDFSTQDCELLEAFAPHLRQAWERHPDPWLFLDASAMPLRHRFQTELGLTLREADVLQWIVDGKLNSEIATILSISRFTVQKHVANILIKTGMENRYALLAYAQQFKLGRGELTLKEAH